MNITGTKMTWLTMNTTNNNNSQITKVNKTLQNIAANYQQKANSTGNTRAQAGFQVLSFFGNVDNNMALSIIDTADEGLSQTEIILREMMGLLNVYNDPTKNLTNEEKEKINEELQNLLEELNQLSDNNLMLDGSFGGVLGEDGILDMGIDEITSTGNFDGKVKFNVAINQNGVQITARMGDKCVTNDLKFSDTETAFDFGNSKIMLKFNNGAGNLKSGIIKNVSFSLGSQEANLSSAVSRDKKSNEIGTIGKNGKMVKIPDLIDVSAVGLKLNEIKINGLMDIKNALTKISESLKKIGYIRKHLSEAKTAITGFNSKG